MVEIESGDVMQMRDASVTDLLDDINQKAAKAPLGKVVGWVGLILGVILLFVSASLGAVVLLLTLPAWGIARWLDSYHRRSAIFYDLEPDAKSAYEQLVAAFDGLNACGGKWHVSAGGRVTDTTTWKRNAGATHIVAKKPTAIAYELPKVVACNITPPSVQVGLQTLHFLPDVVLVMHAGKAGAISYQSLQASAEASQFIEEGPVPKDAQVVGRTWKHPNKSGGPDRRFSNNYQIPICRYEMLHLAAASGLNEQLEFSKVGVSQPLIAAMRALGALALTPSGKTAPSREQAATVRSEMAKQASTETVLANTTGPVPDPEIQPVTKPKLEHGIEALTDGFRCNGYRFATYEQALSYARRREPGSERDDPVIVSPSERPDHRSQLDVPPAAPAQVNTEASPSPLKVLKTADGFSCNGYRFQTYEQAQAYAARLNPAPPFETPLPRLSELVAFSQREEQLVQAPPATQTSRPSKWRWHGPAEPITVAGVIIGSPMTYVGADHSWQAPRELIDPAKQVASYASTPTDLPYYPAYHELNPTGRRAYLEWLADGRLDSVPVGFAFIFFYGLERRVFGDKAIQDIDVIIEEVDRLAAMFPDNPSFRIYARRFVNAAKLLRGDDCEAPELSPDIRQSSWEIPIDVRRHLGKRLAGREAFGPDDALMWVLSLPDTWLTTPARRCFPELVELWRIRFGDRFPDGLKVRAPKRRLAVSYRSASNQVTTDIDIGDLPDIAAVSAPLSGLRDLLTSCASEFENLSRLLLKKPAARDTLEGALCLPAELMEAQAGEKVRGVRATVEAWFGDRSAVAVATKDVLALLEVDLAEAKMTAAAQKQVAILLDRVGYAFEPDRRHTEASMSLDGSLALFRGPIGGPEDDARAAFMAARAMVEIALLAASSDGEIVQAELDQVAADLASIPELSAADRDRLTAHGLWLSRDPPRLQAALTKLGKMPGPTKAAATKAAIATVLADGRVLPVEVRFLERLHKALGLKNDELYSALHRGGVHEEPAAAAVGARPTSPGDIAIDHARLARLREETSQVSSMLTSIFDEEAGSDAPPQKSVPETRSSYPGLEGRHAELLARLVASGRLDRDEFDAQARELKLLPSGALETINEWSFDTFDEPVLDDEDDIVVADHLTARLIALEAAE